MFWQAANFRKHIILFALAIATLACLCVYFYGFLSQNWFFVGNTSDSPIHVLVQNSRGMSSKEIRAEIQRQHINVNECNINGVSPLHAAVLMNPSAISPLVSEGANIDCQDQNGNTPLHYAVEIGSVESVKGLLRLHSKAQLRNRSGLTPRELLVHSTAVDAPTQKRILGIFGDI